MANPQEQFRTGQSDPELMQRQRVHTTFGYAMGGSTSEAIAGAAAVVLSIIALASVGSIILLSIATIAVGAALVFEGGAIASRFSSLMRTTSTGGMDASEFGGGMSAELLGGLVVVTLGILALIGISPLMLTSVSAIIAGGALLIGAGATTRMNEIRLIRPDVNEESLGLARASLSSATSMHVFIGVGAAILGILSVIGFNPMILTLVAMLGVGFSVLLSGAALSAIASMFRS